MINNQSSFFSLYEQISPTNKDLTITFTPEEHIVKYEYIILKNNLEYKRIDINNSLPSNIFLDETGQYKISINGYDYNENLISYNSGIYNVDKEKPVITLDNTSIDMPIGSNIIVMGGVKAYDKQSGNLIERVTTNYKELDFTTEGLKKLTYTVVDDAGNAASKIVYINVYDSNIQSVMTFQYIVLSILAVIFFMITRYLKGLNLENRIAQYSIEPIATSGLSLGDKIGLLYKKMIDKISKILSISTLIKKNSKRYEKYVNVVNETYSNPLDYVSEKIIISLFFLLVAFLAKLVQYELINVYEIIIPVFFGFFTPNIIYMVKYRNYRNRLENDFLQAITVMNNAFKSGNSIIQAIELVTNEIEGPISREFQKMALEINFGLSIDIVFKRFAKRIKLEEATYLTVALTILSKTGGNINNVFTSIEKTLFNKKKLKLELKSLTGGSKIIVNILIGLPILFVLVVNLINPNYFIPLYTTEIGGILVILMMTIYLTYIYIIQKFVRVRVW